MADKTKVPQVAGAPTGTKVPHKHAAVIKAWADGAAIEARDTRSALPVWNQLTRPSWYDHHEYRVKPEPHKYQDLIDAFRSGATDIQWRGTDGVWRYATENFTVASNSDTDFEGIECRRAHKWQKEMDAFAAGKQIQLRLGNEGRWFTFAAGVVPQWHEDYFYEFRIKPELEVYYMYARRGYQMVSRPKKLMTDNLKLTFEEGKLVKAEVL